MEAEIDFMYEAYESLINRIDLSYKNEIESLKNDIKKIHEDTSSDWEELYSQSQASHDRISELETQRDKFLNNLFAIIYSHWEISLNYLCNNYKIEILKKNGKRNYAPKIDDYLKSLLGNQFNKKIPEYLLKGFDEYRNYCIHGSLSPERKKIIKNISTISINETSNGFTLASFEELHKVNQIIRDALKKIELTKRETLENSNV